MNTYPTNYKVKSIEEQKSILFCLLKKAEEANATFPEWVEWVFVIPHFSKVADTYIEALEKVFTKLKETRPCESYIEFQNIRQTEKKEKAMDRLMTKDNFILLPAQFWERWKWKSVEDARKCMGENEFWLGAYEVVIMLLTHPERLQSYDDLWIDCAGDEYSPDDGGAFGCAPRLRFGDGGVELGSGRVARFSDRYGSASAVGVPQ